MLRQVQVVGRLDERVRVEVTRSISRRGRVQEFRYDYSSLTPSPRLALLLLVRDPPVLGIVARAYCFLGLYEILRSGGRLFEDSLGFWPVPTPPQTLRG